MTLQISSQTHYATVMYGTTSWGNPRESALEFLKQLKKGTADAAPMQLVNLQDDFRPFLKKDLRRLWEKHGIMRLEVK